VSRTSRTARTSRRRTHPVDPFGEQEAARYAWDAQLLGAHFLFECDDARLHGLVRQAFNALPPHRLRPKVPSLRVRLALLPDKRGRGVPPVATRGAPGLLLGAGDGSAVIAVAPREHSALLVVPPRLLDHAYHLRYELLEFAVYLLAARTQELVPLHAGCVARAGQAVLLVGQSGAGKSTLTLHCLSAGMDFLAEDSVLVEPQSMRATGLPSFLHLRADSMRFLDRRAARRLRASPVIRRRSGVRKYEVDLRLTPYRLVVAPPRIVATVLLVPSAPAARCRLRPLGARALSAAMRREQLYARGQPRWEEFLRRLMRLPSFTLYRGKHPAQSVAALEALLAGKA
jgi:hypothetical protein